MVLNEANNNENNNTYKVQESSLRTLLLCCQKIKVTFINIFILIADQRAV